MDTIGIDAIDGMAEMELDAASAEDPLRTSPEAGRESGEQVRLGFDEVDEDVGVGMGDGSRELNARRTSADDHDRGGGGDGRAQRNGVVGRAQPGRVIDAFDGWPGGFGASGDDNGVGLDAMTVGQLDSTIVHRDDRADLDLAHEPIERLASVALRCGPTGDSGETSHEVVIPGAIDDRDGDAEALDGPHGV
ncbi:MAG: hypothetical protein EA389_00225 [Ilumatobacter sp.]|nr:MAG: hypothetical protein EA389_00225 [Ilumatobacter sp.]